MRLSNFGNIIKFLCCFFVKLKMSEIIEDGTLVLLIHSNKYKWLLKIEAGKGFHTHRGIVQLGDLIGKTFGSRIKSTLNAEYVAIKPTIGDLMYKVSRKSQIIYTKDTI